ncbi:receptor-type tyrosine-protein phosphatase [Holotrichia oblita]|uniref:Receptor-type tyrosine-protein phosphatase n=1 Tax=Holotrichia oblita TaxID=644536 RepID=A0ACB9TF25_HOLOL|nr:receptor-type tyrosine-protein phosphatase [Holotrichia oblita]
MQKFIFIAELGLLKAEVYAGMKNRTYNVEITLDVDGQIKEGSCTYPRGQFVCHHMAATCLYGHEQISVTDVQCQWTVRRSIDRVTQTVEASLNVKRHRSADRNLTDEEIKEFHEKL